MTDLFGPQTCPCCGQAIPEEPDDSAFNDFWTAHPGKPQNKQGARKKFDWIVKSGVPASLLSEKAQQYAEFCRRTEKPPRLPCTWLNQRGWEDDTLKPAPKPVDPFQSAAEAILSKQKWRCTNIAASTARILIEQGAVTRDQCKAVGVI